MFYGNIKEVATSRNFEMADIARAVDGSTITEAGPHVGEGDDTPAVQASGAAKSQRKES